MATFINVYNYDYVAAKHTNKEFSGRSLSCVAARPASRLLLTLTGWTPDQSKSPHRGFFEIQPWWWVILAPALSGETGESDHVPRIAEESRGVRHHFDGSSPQNLPNCSPPNESSLLNLKAIMFPEWEERERHLMIDWSCIWASIPIVVAILILNNTIGVRSSQEYVKRIFVERMCSIFSSHICEAVWVMGW